MKKRKTSKKASTKVPTKVGKPVRKPKKKIARRQKPLTTEQNLRLALLRILNLEPAASPGMTTQLGVNLETAQDIAREALGD